MMRLLVCSFVGLLVLISAAQGQNVVTTVTSGTNQPTSLQSNIGGLSLGYVKAGSSEVAALAWRPDFKIGPWGLGADVNLYLGQDKPAGYENAVLRYVEYDDGRKGLRYGVIDNLTWGRGLLLNNYSSRVYGPLILSNEQLAYRGYVDLDSYVVRGLVTRTGLYGLRVEERISPLLILGQTVITDLDGVTPLGTTESQKVTGIGIDAVMPLPLNFEGFAEAAQLVGRGAGYGAGLSWGYDLMVANASFLAEYRVMDKGFIPGYFGADYETNPVNLASAEATNNVKNGYLARFGLGALGLIAANALYEKYNDSENASVAADLFARLPGNIEVTYYYQQPNFSNFRSLSLEEGAITGGSVAYPVNPYTKLVAHFKKVYNPTTLQIEESQYYELRLSF